jgi:hypothetical protein
MAAYKGIAAIRDPLMAWLDGRAGRPDQGPSAGG